LLFYDSGKDLFGRDKHIYLPISGLKAGISFRKVDYFMVCMSNFLYKELVRFRICFGHIAKIVEKLTLFFRYIVVALV